MDNTLKFDMADTVSCLCNKGNSKHCVTTAFPDDTVVAMAYVPFQLDKTSYTPEQALQIGTLFKVLNKPFCGRSVINE